MDNRSAIERDLPDLLERIRRFVANLFDLKRTNKIFIFDNEHLPALDRLLKSELCPTLQAILEHGLKKDLHPHLWKLIDLSLSSRNVPSAYLDAKHVAQTTSSNGFDRFQAFIYALLNRNELVNWLYYFSRQKDLLQRHYHSPNAWILLSLPYTFNQFERMMTQLEKLSSISFHLTYHPLNDDWTFTLSRRFNHFLSQRPRLSEIFPDRRSVSLTSRSSRSVLPRWK